MPYGTLLKKKVYRAVYCSCLSSIHEKVNCIAIFWTERRNRWGVAIFKMSGPPVFYIKVGTSRLVLCPRTQQANLLACSPQPPVNAKRLAGKMSIPFLKVFWCDSIKRINPRSIDYEADTIASARQIDRAGVNKQDNNIMEGDIDRRNTQKHLCEEEKASFSHGGG